MTLSRVPLNYLEAFVVLAEELSFSRTARALSITQPSVSRQIRLLEERLGAQLFLRDRQRVALTERGRKLKAEVAPLFRELVARVESAREEGGRIAGTVRFGSLAEIGQSVFMPMLLRFQRDRPDVHLSVEYLKEVEIAARLREGKLDFGIVTREPGAEDLRAFELFSEQAVLVTRGSNSADLERSQAPKFVTYRESDPLLERFLAAHRRSVPALRRLVVTVSVNSHRSMIEALLASDTFAVVPRSSVEDLLGKGALRIALDRGVSSRILVVHPYDPYPAARNRELREFLVRECRKKFGRRTR